MSAQFCALLGGRPGHDQAAVAAVGVVLAHPGGLGLRDAVAEEFDAADLQPLVAEAAVNADRGDALLEVVERDGPVGSEQVQHVDADREQPLRCADRCRR